MEKSSIQWTDATWNVAVGCTKVDEDCKYCYMYRDSMGSKRYDPLTVRKTTSVFEFPLKYKAIHSEVWPGRPLIFTSSLTDVFHEAIDGYRNEVWDIIRRCPHLIFQILTKRPERIKDNLPRDWGDGWDNVWLGTSIGSENSHRRLYDLLKVPSLTRFLSLEPLWGEIDFYRISGRWPNDYDHPWRNSPILTGIDWVIVGGESGNDFGKYTYRQCHPAWFNLIQDQCESVGVPLFVKQLGTYLHKTMGLQDRHGGDINEFPNNLKVREFPLTKI